MTDTSINKHLRHPTYVHYRPAPVPEQTRLQEVLHEGHSAARTKIIAALEDSVLRTHTRWAARMRTCGNVASFFLDSESGTVKPWISRCGHKACPFCARARSARVAAQLTNLLHKMTRPRLAILTIRSEDTPLHDQLKQLRLWFQRLRKRKDWTSRIKGGAYTLEVTINRKTGRWHPHLHIVFEGKYFPQKLLRKLWHDVTGDSEIVWVNDVTDKPGAARELAKYIGKPQRISSQTPEQIRTFISATHSIRMVSTFGSCYGLAVQDRDQAEAAPAPTTRISLGRLVMLTRQGQQTPAKILLAIAQRWPVFASYVHHEFPQLSPEPTLAERYRHLAQVLEDEAANKSPPSKTHHATAAADAQLVALFRKFKLEEEQDMYVHLDYIAEVG